MQQSVLQVVAGPWPQLLCHVREGSGWWLGTVMTLSPTWEITTELLAPVSCLQLGADLLVVTWEVNQQVEVYLSVFLVFSLSPYLSNKYINLLNLYFNYKYTFPCFQNLILMKSF